MNEKDLFDFDYSLYLEHLAVCQNNTVRCVAEAVCISEGQIDNLISVNEAFIDTVKNIVNRIIAAVKKQFAKFVETMSGLFTPDSKWLKDPKRKDIILNNPWKDREPFEMTQYHEENFDKFLIQPFDFDNFRQVTTADNVEAEFIRTYFKNTGDTIKADGGEIKDQIKEAIMGEEEETRITSLDKAKMYDFCINWEATLKKLETDNNRLNEASGKLATALGNYTRDIQNELENGKDSSDSEIDTGEEKPEPKQGEVAKAANTDVSDEAIAARQAAKAEKVESSTFSLLYDTFVTEAIGKTGAPIENKSSGGSTSSKGTANARIATGAGAIKINNANAAETVKSGMGAGANSEKVAEVKKMQENTGQYFTLLSSIVMAKLTAAQSMYKDYMKLLRMHVKDYAGEEAGTKDNSVPAESTYRKEAVTVKGFNFTKVSHGGKQYLVVGQNVFGIEGDASPEAVQLLDKYKGNKATGFNADVHLVEIKSVETDSAFGTIHAAFLDGKWKIIKTTNDNKEAILNSIKK